MGAECDYNGEGIASGREYSLWSTSTHCPGQNLTMTEDDCYPRSFIPELLSDETYGFEGDNKRWCWINDCASNEFTFVKSEAEDKDYGIFGIRINGSPLEKSVGGITLIFIFALICVCILFCCTAGCMLGTSTYA